MSAILKWSGAWAKPDPEALADAVLRLATRPVERCRTAARQRAEQFPWSSTIAGMLDLHQHAPQSAVDRTENSA